MNHRIAVSLTGTLALMSLAAPAHAYLDPATGSIILQALIGAVAGATLFFRTQLYRVRTFFGRGTKANDGE